MDSQSVEKKRDVAESLVCDLCPARLETAYVCSSCGRGFCEAHGGQHCPICPGNTFSAKVTKETKGKADIAWLSLGGNVSIGISQSTHIPTQFLATRNWFLGRKSPSLLQVILFPTLPDGRLFVDSLGGQVLDYRTKYTKNKVARSRYSLIGPTGGPEMFLLLYTKVLSGDALVYLLDLFNQEVNYMQAYSKDMPKGLPLTAKFAKAYASKFGFDFVTPSRELQLFSLRGAQLFWSTYAEVKAVQKLASSNPSQTASFLSEKIDLLFLMFDWPMIEWFEEVLDVMGRYLVGVTFIRSVRGHGNLEDLLLRRFEKHDLETRSKLKNHPDLVTALDSISKETIGVNEDYGKYLSKIEATLIAAVNMLKPEYVRLDECVELSDASLQYSREIDLGLKGWTDRFGSVEDYLRTCEAVFNKTGIYPEIRVMAGVAMAHVLESMILRGHSYIAYLRFLKLSEELASLAETAIPVARKKNPKTVVNFIDPALQLTAAHSFARMNFEPEEAERMWRIARPYVDRHDIKMIKIQMLWTDFLRTSNYDHLREIERLGFEIETMKPIGYEGMNRFLGKVATALLQDSDQNKTLEEAEARLGHDVSPDGLLSVVLDQFSLEYSTFLTRLLRAVFACASERTAEKVRNLSTIARVMDQEISPITDLRSLPLKSQILCGVLQGDWEALERSSAKIQQFCEKDSPLSRFVSAAVNWARATSDTRSVRLYQVLNSELDHQDPWSRVLGDFMRESVRQELRPEDILDFDVLIGVEGEVDSRVYPVLFRRAGITMRVLCVDAEGWTNMNYVANAKVAIAVGRPIVVFFDGDTSARKNKDVKDALVGSLGVPPERVVTLAMNALEDYLLVPGAIKRAFPQIDLSISEIGTVFKDHESKKNKKEVLDRLLKEHANLRYDEDTAGKIAEQISSSELDGVFRATIQGVLGPLAVSQSSSHSGVRG